ncbi:MAG: hypothetical protein ABJP06_04940 [Sulfitobacter sp.]
MMKAVAFALAALVAFPAHAKEFRSTNGMHVRPVNANSWTVSGIPDRTPQSHWCASAEYAQRVLGASFNQRMYVVGNAKRGQREYLISLSPKGTISEGGRSKQFGIRLDGANRRVDEGLDFCRNTLRVPG